MKRFGTWLEFIEELLSSNVNSSFKKVSSISPLTAIISICISAATGGVRGFSNDTLDDQWMALLEVEPFRAISSPGPRLSTPFRADNDLEASEYF